MNVYEMIQSWRQSCQCDSCTRELVERIENKVKPELSYIGNAAKSPDNVLDQAKGVYDKVVVLGLDEENRVDVRASTNITNQDILWCIEKFKSNLLLDMEHGH